MATEKFRAGFLLFPNLTQLDLTGPYEIISAMPDVDVTLLWKTLEPVRAERGLSILPTGTFDACDRLDLLCVPGGTGINALLDDPEVLLFIRRIARDARYVTSVCTGSLVLGAAGLLRGRRAACHWMSRHLLAAFDAEPVAERVVVDGNIITGGGVTAGIDFALRVVAEIHGQAAAEAIQLGVEYAPAPPFDAGTPATASPDTVARVRERMAPMIRERTDLVRRAALRLGRKTAAA
jgi:cyclohexyl-isocyanide hydratase